MKTKMKKHKKLYIIANIILTLGLLLSISVTARAVTEDDLKSPETYGGWYHYCHSDSVGSHTSDYNYVYFGMYPQREIKGKELTDAIINAAYDENHDAVVNGKRYRRMDGMMINTDGSWSYDITTKGYRYFIYEPMKWKILSNKRGVLFLQSDYILDYRKMNARSDLYTWKDCDLREWLNHEGEYTQKMYAVGKETPGFYNVSFSDIEKKQILLTDVIQDENPKYLTTAGEDTEDRIFLLSIDEATTYSYGYCDKEYLGNYCCGKARDIYVTEYALAMIDETSSTYGAGPWFLRTSGEEGKVSVISYLDDYKYNRIRAEGFYCDSYLPGVVPAMRVSYDLNSCIRICFDTNGADVKIEDQILLGSGYAKEPVTFTERRAQKQLILTKGGYTSTGWYYDKECTKPYNFNEILTKDTTLYAGWPKPENLKGGVMKIEGTTTAMEYASSLDNKATWTSCSNGTTAVPKAGTWYVRYKKTDKLEPSDAAKVTVTSFEQAVNDYADANDISKNTTKIEDSVILSRSSDKDIAGSSFAQIQASAESKGKNTIKLKWNKVKKADGYDVYGAPCNKGKKKNKYQLIKSITGNGKTQYTQKKLKKGTYYKYIVRAYKLIEGKKVSIAVSKTMHAATTGGKYGNAKSVKLKTDTKLVYNKKKKTYNLTLKKNKKYTIKASEVKQSKKIQKHRKIAFESSNSNIATVSTKGVIKGKKKGSCYVYVYAQNGKYKRITVKVK